MGVRGVLAAFAREAERAVSVTFSTLTSGAAVPVPTPEPGK